ncbi:hypothetical protein [Salegentibacter flavus]|uniref:Uncharacterized protein n=1 Tax=Salegentibacter flavus TaxID=287099 RepID=A0A1I5DII6_9FLAO|nr:hypothetical protein [Salegentibacter flavus]SFN99074.1 hypothetical protein SAMN05660413_03351 [Salegentibacter flavus]
MDKILRLFIGVIQIVGGLILVYAFFNRLAEVGMVSFLTVTLPLLILIGICIYAGTQLILNRPRGIALSIFNFALQLFQFSFFGIYWYYFIGPYVSFGYQKPATSDYNFWIDYEYFTGTSIIYLRDDSESHFFLINLMALIMILALIYLRVNFKDSIVPVEKNTAGNNI